MDVTLRELADQLEIPAHQIPALLFACGIQPAGTLRTGKRGRPATTYDLGAVQAACAEEARRTVKQFLDNDWIASALLARGLVRVDAGLGEVWWTDGSRAEQLGSGGYGWVPAGSAFVAAHRIIWIAAEGEIPYPLQVIHTNKLRWDNRRANLELATFGNSIRHAHGAPYISYRDAVRELAELQPSTPAPAINPYGGNFVGGRLLAGAKAYRPGR